jgi:hypothetical protein
MGTIRDEGRLGTFENTRSFQCSNDDARKMGGCTGVLWGCELCHTPDLGLDCKDLLSRKGGKKMSVRSAALVHELSMAWLRNAFAGFLAASVLVLLLILVP